LILDSVLENLNYAQADYALRDLEYGKQLWNDIYPMPTTTTDVSFKYQAFVNKGHVLNVEDFYGIINIYGSEINDNHLFFPDILNVEHTKETHFGLEDFYNRNTSEWRFAICDPFAGANRYLLSTGFEFGVMPEEFIDRFERVSTIYVSRNKFPVILAYTNMEGNMGTFGGAFFFNSMDFKYGQDPYAIISNSNFIQNYAYLGGNAGFIRPTIKGDLWY